MRPFEDRPGAREGPGRFAFWGKPPKKTAPSGPDGRREATWVCAHGAKGHVDDLRGIGRSFMTSSELGPGELTIRALQRQILETFGAKDAARGDAGTFLWFSEEVGELASALRSGTDEELALEMADVLAWLVTLANVRGIDLEAAVLRKYGASCPKCGQSPCACDRSKKP